MRADLQTSINGVRADLQTSINDVRTDLQTYERNHNERQLVVENRLTKLEAAKETDL